MQTFTSKLDALSDHYTSEMQKLQQALREQIGEYVREELKDYSGVILEIYYSTTYESFVVCVATIDKNSNANNNKSFSGIILHIETELNKCSEEMQQAFISDYIVEF